MSNPRSLQSFGEQAQALLDKWRQGVPALFTLLIMLLHGVPLFLDGPLWPNWGLLSVYYWSVHRPDLMPPWLAFFLGVAADALIGAPIGLNASLFLVSSAALVTQYHVFASRPFVFDWVVVMPVVLLFQGSCWGVLQLMQRPLPFGAFLLQGVATILAYPAVCWLAAVAQRRLVDRAFA